MSKKLVFFLLFQFMSCQVYNSASNDSVQFSSDGTPFGDAKVILATKCTPCHSYYLRTQTDLIFTGLVVPNDIYSSFMFSRLKGANAGGLEDMPIGSQLSDDEIAKIQVWIESI